MTKAHLLDSECCSPRVRRRTDAPALSRGACMAMMVAALIMFGTSREATAVEISLKPSTLTLGPNSTALFAVQLAGADAGVAAFQFDLVFDPSAVYLTDPNAGSGLPPFAPLGENPFCTVVRGTAICNDPPWLLTSTGRTATGSTGSGAGYIQIAYGTSGESGLPTDTGALAIVAVTSLTDQVTCITIENAIVADNSDPPTPFPVSASEACINSVAAYPVSGSVTYETTSSPVADVVVNLSGPASVSTSTVGTGAYSFPSLVSGTWTVEPTRSGGVGRAVTAFDAALALADATGGTALGARQRLAADVDGDGSITNADVELILQRAVGANLRFPVAMTCQSDWLFFPVPAAMVTSERQPITGPDSCTPGAIVLDHDQAPQVGIDFSAIAFGDCSANWVSQGD